MRRSTLVICALCFAVLAGCQPSSPAASAPEPHASRPTPVDGDAPDPEDDVIVSTNEPFWQVHSEGDRITLRGLDGPERQFTGARASMTAGGRRLHASDAQGEIVLVVRRLGCKDDMSGARFPMTAMLNIDGNGPFRGCARPASMPAPVPPLESEGGGPAEAAATGASDDAGRASQLVEEQVPEP